MQYSGPGGTLIFSHIRRLGPFSRVQNLEFQYFSLVYQKGECICGCEDFVDIFGRSSQNWTGFRGHFCAF